MGKGNYAYAFRAGVEIGPKKQFNPPDSRMVSSVRNNSSTKTFFRGPWATDGKGVKTRYLGLRFILHGKLHFGWARVTITYLPKDRDLFGHAQTIVANYQIKGIRALVRRLYSEYAGKVFARRRSSICDLKYTPKKQ